jgi:hypothetical protein
VNEKLLFAKRTHLQNLEGREPFLHQIAPLSTNRGFTSLDYQPLALKTAPRPLNPFASTSGCGLTHSNILTFGICFGFRDSGFGFDLPPPSTLNSQLIMPLITPFPPPPNTSRNTWEHLGTPKVFLSKGNQTRFPETEARCNRDLARWTSGQISPNLAKSREISGNLA